MTDSENEGICHSCWLNIDSFHEFFNSVSSVYDTENINIEEIECLTDEEETTMSIIKLEDIIIEENQQTSKDESTSIYYDESMNYETEWITEDHEQSETEKDFSHQQQQKISNEPEPQQFSMSDTADDQRIKETANMFCDICMIPVESLRDAKSHYKQIHHKEGFLMCCGRKFKQRCRLVEHVNTTHYNFSHPCLICDKKFDSKSYLTKHMACHETIKQYKCDHCPKKFAKKFQVRNHLLSVHIFDNVEPDLECPLENCYKKFVNHARLKHHIDYTHSLSHFEICEFCSKIFKTKNAIEEHKKTHMRKPEDRIKVNC